MTTIVIIDRERETISRFELNLSFIFKALNCEFEILKKELIYAPPYTSAKKKGNLITVEMPEWCIEKIKKYGLHKVFIEV